MAFLSDKWRNSSVITKAATVTMALNALLTFVCNVPVMAGFVGYGAVEGMASGTGDAGVAAGLGAGIVMALIWFIFFVGIQVLLAFGILKVNNVARGFTILEGLGAALFVAVVIAGWQAGMSAMGSAGATYSGLMGMLAKLIWGLLPASVKRIMGLFVLPYILQVLSMLLLFFCGKDFAKISQPVILIRRVNKRTAYILCIFLGWCSAHRFYLEKTGSGILFLLTAQLAGIGWIYDLITLGRQVDMYNAMYGGGAEVNTQQSTAAPIAADAPKTTVSAEKQG